MVETSDLWKRERTGIWLRYVRNGYIENNACHDVEWACNVHGKRDCVDRLSNFLIGLSTKSCGLKKTGLVRFRDSFSKPNYTNLYIIVDHKFT